MTNNTYIPIVFPAGFQKGFSLRYFYILGERLPCLEYGISRQETWQSSEKLAPSIINVGPQTLRVLGLKVEVSSQKKKIIVQIFECANFTAKVYMNY